MKKSLFMSLSALAVLLGASGSTLANTAPQITGKPVTTAITNQFYQFRPHGTDIDVDDSLTYAVSNLPSWASFNPTTSELAGIAKLVGNQVSATANVQFTMNLDSRSAPPLYTNFDPLNTQSYNFSSTVVIYDNAGDPIRLGIYFALTPFSGQWNVHLSVNGIDLSGVNGGGVGGGIAGHPATTFIFDNKGKSAIDPQLPISMNLAQFNAGQVNLHWRNDNGSRRVTQVQFPYEVKHFAQDGVSKAEAEKTASIGVSVKDSSAASAALPPFTLTVFADSNSVDTDGDGITDVNDVDDDNDGTLDTDDAFPFDSTEIVDTDGDGIGNNLDTDDDNDGLPDVSDPDPLVSSVNRAPNILGMPKSWAAKGGSYSFTPTGNDPDGDSYTYNITNKPLWATFNSATGQLSGTNVTQDTALLGKMTENIYYTMNLDSRLQPPIVSAFDPSDAASYNSSSSLTIYDSLGEAHIFGVYFVKVQIPDRTWNVHVTIDGTDLSGVLGANVGGGIAGEPASVLSFTSDGVPATNPLLPVSITGGAGTTGISGLLNNGATFPVTLVIHWTSDVTSHQPTQLPADFNVIDVHQDGASIADARARSQIEISVTDSHGAKSSLPTFSIEVVDLTDTDNDGTIDYIDTDDDGDGVADHADLEPLNDQRWTNTDTDSDGITDDVEIINGLDINNPLDVWIDDDGERLPLIIELLEARNPNEKDNDVFTNHRLLVHQAYIDVTQQFASQSDIDFWVGRLADKSSLPVDIYSSLVDMIALNNMGFIGRVYLGTFGRLADAGGARFHLKRLAAGVSRFTMLTDFMLSEEFHSRYGNLSDDEFIRLAYRNVLGREADEAGVTYWLSQLQHGVHSRASFFYNFIESVENFTQKDLAQKAQVLSLLVTGKTHDEATNKRYRDLLQEEFLTASSVFRALLASDAYHQGLMDSMPSAVADADSDGIINGIEFVDGTDPNFKDNDIDNVDHLFVKQVLRDMVGEYWSYHQINTGLSNLKKSISKAAMLVHYLDDPRFKTARGAIVRLYISFFERRVDHTGLMYWLNRYETDMSLIDIAEVFALGTEFQTRYGTLEDDAFIDLVYQNVLGRPADSDGRNYWIRQLTIYDVERGYVMAAFSDSRENQARHVNNVIPTLLYSLFLQRGITHEEFVARFDELNSGATAEAMIEAILGSNEYRGRFY